MVTEVLLYAKKPYSFEPLYQSMGSTSDREKKMNGRSIRKIITFTRRANKELKIVEVRNSNSIGRLLLRNSNSVIIIR